MKRRGLVPTMLVMVAMASPVAAGLFRVWVNQDAVAVGYQLSEQTRRRRELDARIRQLEVELAAQRAPTRLTGLARRLGLAPVTPDRVFGATGPSSARSGGSHER